MSEAVTLAIIAAVAMVLSTSIPGLLTLLSSRRTEKIVTGNGQGNVTQIVERVEDRVDEMERAFRAHRVHTSSDRAALWRALGVDRRSRSRFRQPESWLEEDET